MAGATSHRRTSRLAAWLAALLCLPVVALASSITLMTGYTEEVEGVHFLNADIQYELGEQALDALDSGLPLRLSIEVQVRRPRFMWPDATVTEFEHAHTIQFQPLTRLYVIENEQTGRRQSFQSYASAIAELSRVEDVPVVEDSELDADRRYELRMRVTLAVRERPEGLGFIARLWTDSSISSGWYQWTLRS